MRPSLLNLDSLQAHKQVNQPAGSKNIACQKSERGLVSLLLSVSVITYRLLKYVILSYDIVYIFYSGPWPLDSSQNSS